MDGIIDKTTNIKQGFDNEIETQSVFNTIITERLDTVAYVQANQYIWRYPVATKPAPDFGTMPANKAFLTKQDFVTFMLYDDALSSTGATAEYQPIHENGNLFSYPSDVENIENYKYKQKELSEKRNVQFGTTRETTGLKFTKVKENETTESKKVETGYLSQALSLVDGLLGTDFAKVPAGESGPTYTRNQSSSEQVMFNMPNAGAAPLLNGYYIEYQAYTADNGAITCGFAVNKLNRYLNLFNSESLYSKYPDPSFVLPYKFSLKDSSGELPAFEANDNREVAMEMRGVRFYAEDYNRYTTGRLLGNAAYTIKIPLYNASFYPANNVRVDLYWVKNRTAKGLGEKQLIGTQYVNLEGWSGNEENKKMLEFAFTPDTSVIPANKQGEHYQLYAVIDPDDNMKEVHEKRDMANDPGGNNEGYFEFSVEDPASAISTSNLEQNVIRASAEGDGEAAIIWPEITFNGEASWGDFYDKYISGTTGPAALKVVIVNKMPYTLPDTEFKITYFDTSNPDNVGIESAVYGKSFTLFPNETYETSLVIDGDFADKLREAGKDNTYGGYTMFWLENLIEEVYGEEIVIESDDNKPEVLSADVIDDPDNADNYVQSVISRIWTLSNDKPVFWRTNGVFVMVDTSSDIGSSAAPLTATEEDFVIVWEPDNLEDNKASEATITASTIAGVTPKGKYALAVEISEDGENWEEKEALEFDAESSSINNNNGGEGGANILSSSKGGCNSGLSVLSLGILLILRRKAR